MKDAEEFGWDLGAAQVGELGEVGGDASEPKVERREVSEGKSQLGPSDEKEGDVFFSSGSEEASTDFLYIFKVKCIF